MHINTGSRGVKNKKCVGAQKLKKNTYNYIEIIINKSVKSFVRVRKHMHNHNTGFNKTCFFLSGIIFYECQYDIIATIRFVIYFMKCNNIKYLFIYFQQALIPPSGCIIIFF